MTSGLYSPVRLSRLISKKLVFVVYSRGEEEEESQKRHYASPPLHKRDCCTLIFKGVGVPLEVSIFMVQERFSQYLQTTQPRVKIVFLTFVVIKRGINAVG